MKETAGRWNRDGRGIAFMPYIESFVGYAIELTGLPPYVLIAVNEIKSEEALDRLEVLASKCSVFLDSGVFNLANTHARRNNMTMDQALALAPSDIDGFDGLLANYKRIISRVGDRLWGYTEIDQGGRENKKKTRAMLEADGLRPIPVYHPINDGWDYFDELASTYDRLCFGNIVQCRGADRSRLVFTAYERKKKYPHLWIHCLGLSPNELVISCPPDSCDSSTWAAPVRWPDGAKATVSMKGVSRMERALAYDIRLDSEDPSGWGKAVRLAMKTALMNTRQWQSIMHDRGAK